MAPIPRLLPQRSKGALQVGSAGLAEVGCSNEGQDNSHFVGLATSSNSCKSLNGPLPAA